jgi:hypothetical protein
MLDGLIREATGGIEDPRFDESLGGAGIEAASATTTVIGLERSVDGEL